MGIFNLMAAIAKVKEERDSLNDAGRESSFRDDSGQEHVSGGFAAIDPDSGMKAFATDQRPLPPAAVPSSFIQDVQRYGNNEATSNDAARMGDPNVAGMNIRGVQQLLSMRELPDKQKMEDVNIDEKRAMTDKLKADAARKKSINDNMKDPLWLEAVKTVNSSADPFTKMQLSSNPEMADNLYNGMFQRLKSFKAGKNADTKPPTPRAAAAGASGQGSFGSKEDVVAAVKSGKLQKDEAVKILRSKFGMK